MKENIKSEKISREFKETKSYLRQIISDSKVLIITTNNKGQIVEFNPEAEEQLGYKKEEVINKPVTILWQNPEEREKLLELVRKHGAAKNKEICLKSKNGKSHYVNLTLSELKNDHGKVVGTVGVSKNISEQKMLHHKLLESEKLAGIGTLASGIAHEINNPLAGILGMAEAIAEENDLKTIKSFAKNIINYTSEASSTVKELTNYSHSIANKSISTIDLSVIMEDSLKFVKHLLDFSRIKIISDLRKECWINANSGEIQQIFSNLVANAVHAMEGNGGKLILSCSNDGQLIRGIVADTGTGIKKEHLNQIYDPFFTTKPPGKGTGLGLYVIYNIVSKYRGNIDVVSEEGEGTSFTISLPWQIPLPFQDPL